MRGRSIGGLVVPLGLVIALELLLGTDALARPRDPGAGGEPVRITGVVVGEADGLPLAHVVVLVRETGGFAETDAEGRFAVEVSAAGWFTLEAIREGYVRWQWGVAVSGDVPEVTVDITLTPIPRFLSEVVVTPSRYALYGSGTELATSLTRQEVERLPHLAQDAFRAVRWLPGTAGEDFSALINVRGGEVDETLVLIDGLEVQKAFHLEELFGGVQSVVDAEAVDDLEFMSGGFPVEFGDRMSGVIRMGTTASGPSRTTLGASTTHVGLSSAGPFGAGRGRWLLSVRRTNLDNVIRWIDPESGLVPRFYDALGKVSCTLGDHTVLSADVLGAWDRTRYTEEDVGAATFEEMSSRSSGRYAWLRLDTAPKRGLLVSTALSASAVDRDVTGSIDEPSQTGSVDDRRSAEFLALKQDWNLDRGDAHALKWGFELRRARGRYHHVSRSEIRDVLFTPEPGEVVVRDRDLDLAPRGDFIGAYAADRVRLSDGLVAELGLRWDRQTHTDGSQLSPRLNLAWNLGERTTLRGAWGLYHQSHHIDELQVSDGLDDFQPAQRSEHRMLSLVHELGRGIALRVDLYQKKLTGVRARYENLLNPIEIFPELESDRVLVAPDRSDARGVEIVLRQDGRRRWSWWLSYARARTQDELGGEWVPRSRDQPHTASFSLNYSPGDAWNLNLSGLYHTGWPRTPILGSLEPGPDGGERLVPYLGPRNSERYPDYLRLDLRASCRFERGPGTWTVFLEVMNLLNRDNQRGLKRIVDYYVDDDGTVRTVPVFRSGFPLLPSLGVRWSF